MFDYVYSKGIKINLSEEDWKEIATPETIAEMLQCEDAFGYDIYHQNTLIGFALLRSFDEGIFLWQYAIDKDFQGRGYGFCVLKALFEKLKSERNVNYFTVTYNFGSERPKKLYEKLGFKETDIVCEDGIHEVNMELYI